MRVASPCPPAEVLQEFLLGAIPDAEAESLEQHLLGCSSCAEALDALAAQDHLVKPMRALPPPLQEPSTGVVDSLIQRLCAQQLLVNTPTGQATSEGASGTGASADEAVREATAFLAPPQQPDELGRLGGYRVLQILGAGGMGVVFQAEDLQLRRPVALKVLKPSLAASALARQRFLREARAAAALGHDHIITIYQAGEDRGTSFLAMQLLHGETLDDRLRRKTRLPVAEVVRIGREVAEGLAAAHARGLIHRDIKPANIWLETVGHVSNVPEPGTLETCPTNRVKILDFGLVRALEGEAHLTQTGVIAGTPQYMAPEQATGGALDARADLFSLGCLLYRMATGQVPFPGDNVLAVLRSLELKQPDSPRQRNPEVPPALADLIMKLLAKKPGNRPASAAAVAEALAAIIVLPPRTDLQSARPPRTDCKSVLPRSKRRRWLAVLGGAGVLVALTFAGYWFWTDQDNPEIPENKTPFARKPPGWCPADDLRRDQIPAYELAAAGGGNPKKAPAELVAVLGDSRLKHWHWIGGLAFSPDGKTIASGSEDQTVKLWDVATGQEKRTFLGHQAGVTCIAYSPDGKLLASGSTDRTLKLWDVTTGQLRRTFPGHQAHVSSVAFSSDSRTLASASNDNMVKLWDVATEKEHHTIKGTFVAFRRDGRTLASICADNTIKLWNVASGKELGSFPRIGGLEWPDFSTDLETVTTQTEGNILKVLDVATGKVRHTLEGHPAPLRVAAFSPDGRMLASGGRDCLIKLWDLTTGEERHTLRGHPGTIIRLAWSRSGTMLASGSDDGSVRLWDVATGKERFPPVPGSRAGRPQGHQTIASFVTISPDGRTLASASADRTIKLWDMATGKESATLKGHENNVTCVLFRPDGRALASAGSDGTVRIWDLAKWRAGAVNPPFITLTGHLAAVMSLAWSPDGKILASGSYDHQVRLWDPHTGRKRGILPGHSGHHNALAFSPDGRTLAMGIEGEKVKLWDLTKWRAGGVNAAAQPVKELHVVTGRSVAFSPRGKRLATAVEPDHTVKVWDVATGKELLTLHGPSRELTSVAFSSDGRWVAAGGWGGSAYWWKVDSGKPCQRTLALSPGGAVEHVSFSPESRHLATANRNSTIFILRLAPRPVQGTKAGQSDPKLSKRQAASGRKLRKKCPADALRRDRIPPYELAMAGRGDAGKAPAELVAVLGDSRLVHGYMVGLVAFSPDGKTVVSACDLDYVKVWDTATGRERCTIPVVPRGRGGWQWLAFSPDSRTLATTEVSGVAWWDVATGQQRRLLGEKEAASSVAFSADGKLFAWASDKDKGSLRLWDLAGNREQRTIPGQPSPTTYLSFSPDSKTLIAGDWHGHTLKRWDVATGQLQGTVKMATGDPSGNFMVALSPDGGTLTAAGQKNGTVKLWDTATGEVRRVLGRHENGVSAIAFSPDKPWLASGGGQASGTDLRGEIKLWNLATGKERPFAQLPGAVSALAFSQDGKTLTAGTLDGVFTLWDVATGKERLPLPGHRAMIYTVAVSSDGGTVASASRDGTVRLWDLAKWRTGDVNLAVQPVKTLRGHTGPVWSAVFRPDGKRLASGSWDGTVKLWDRYTGKLRKTWTAHTWWVYPVAWSPKGDVLASGGEDAMVRIWDPARGQALHTFGGHQTIVAHVAFSPDGRTLASVDEHRIVLLRDAKTGQQRHQLRGDWMAFHPGGKIAATGEPGRVTLWDLGSGDPLKSFPAPGVLGKGAFSPDGEALAVCSSEGTVLLWEVAGGRRPPQTFSLGAQVMDVVFTPEGRHLVAGLKNGTVCVLRLYSAPPKTAKVAHALPRNRNVRPAE